MAMDHRERSRETRKGPKLLSSKLARFVVTVATFALIGPPVGGLVAWSMMGARGLRSPLPFVAGSYGEGVALAAAAGILVGGAAFWLGRTSWLMPVVATVIVNAAMLVAASVADPSQPDLVAALIRVAGVFLPSSLVAAIACWLLTRKLWSPG